MEKKRYAVSWKKKKAVKLFSVFDNRREDFL